MKKLYLCLSVLISLEVSAQNQVDNRDPVVERQYGIIKEVKAKPSGTIGSVYLNEDWVVGKVELSSGDEIANIPMNYDLENKILELNTDKGIKIVELNNLKYFELGSPNSSRKFYNFTYKDIKGMTGIAEELVTGEVSLFSKPEIVKIQANYNQALDVGEKSDRIIKKEKLFLVKDGEANDVTNSGKRILTYLKEKREEIEALVKKENLSYRKRDDIVFIIYKYNKFMQQ